MDRQLEFFDIETPEEKKLLIEIAQHLSDWRVDKKDKRHLDWALKKTLEWEKKFAMPKLKRRFAR